jgi:hypothetical protein
MFEELSNCFSTTFTSLSEVYDDSNLSTYTPTLVIDSIFDCTHLLSVKSYLLVVLICTSLLMSDIVHFYMHIDHFYNFFGEML